MNNIIEYNGKKYPEFQTKGNASQFAIPFAKHFCKGEGYDIGCNRDEWKLEGATPIDLTYEDSYDAMKLPNKKVDYVYSSHCLEHLSNWVSSLDYWISKIKKEGNLFLYLPDYSQEYWRSWNNKKHIHNLNPGMIKDYLKTKDFDTIFTTGIDLNNSFTVVGVNKQ